MPSIVKTIVVPFSTLQMYNLVNDVELYPQFLPWCRRAIVHSRHETQSRASLCLSKGLINHTLSTYNTMIPGSKITMQYTAGLFKQCFGAWEFSATNNEQCQITFNMAYEFHNKIQELALEPFFNLWSNKLVDAFYERAQKLYGK